MLLLLAEFEYAQACYAYRLSRTAELRAVRGALRQELESFMALSARGVYPGRAFRRAQAGVAQPRSGGADGPYSRPICNDPDVGWVPGLAS
jgi:hypothetical protein